MCVLNANQLAVAYFDFANLLLQEMNVTILLTVLSINLGSHFQSYLMPQKTPLGFSDQRHNRLWQKKIK